MRHVLLTDGRIYAGVVTRDGSRTIVKLKGGSVTLTKGQLEGDFGSLAEIYQYKLDRVADDDPEEHQKLANWCIAQKLETEARTELKKVLAMEPGNRQAKAQLFNLEANEARKAQAQVKTKAAAPRADNALVRTSTDVNQDRPVSAGPPAIFDLPPAPALQRYREFALTVHGELQRRCAGCHNETSGLAFQLVRAGSAREQMNDLLLRTNLEATLPLIDRADPARSPLLTASVLPHQGRSILGSPNHPTYRAWAQWVSGIVEPPSLANPPAPAPAPGTTSAGFGSRRPNGAGVVPSTVDQPAEPSVLDAQIQAAAARVRRQEYQADAAHPGVPASTQFPKPGMPPLNTGGGLLPSATATPTPAPGSPPKAALPPGMPPLPAGFEFDPEADPNLKPVADPRRPDRKDLYPAEFDTRKAPGKSRVNLDSLEKFMRPGPVSAPSAPTPPPVPTPGPR